MFAAEPLMIEPQHLCEQHCSCYNCIWQQLQFSGNHYDLGNVTALNIQHSYNAHDATKRPAPQSTLTQTVLYVSYILHVAPTAFAGHHTRLHFPAALAGLTTGLLLMAPQAATPAAPAPLATLL